MSRIVQLSAMTVKSQHLYHTREIQMVAMTDDTAKGKVIINKTDAAGHAESGLYEIATYKNGEFGKSIKYYLVESATWTAVGFPLSLW